MKTKAYDYLPEEAKAIREEVFIKEQGFHSEYDEKDDIATHIVLYDGDFALGTCRIYESVEKGIYMFGRLAVRKEFRKKGTGSSIVKAAETQVLEMGGSGIILHAQLHAKDFYIKCGFTPFCDIDYEQDCPHIWMKKSFN